MRRHWFFLCAALISFSGCNWEEWKKAEGRYGLSEAQAGCPSQVQVRVYPKNKRVEIGNLIFRGFDGDGYFIANYWPFCSIYERASLKNGLIFLERRAECDRGPGESPRPHRWKKVSAPEVALTGRESFSVFFTHHSCHYEKIQDGDGRGERI